MLGLAAAFGRWRPQRLLIEFAIELAEVVEGDTRRSQARQTLAHRRRAEVAQQAEAQAACRHRAQLFLDGLERIAQPFARRQA
ncbi:hypothetical protein D3C78_430120 [compost metagenome]